MFFLFCPLALAQGKGLNVALSLYKTRKHFCGDWFSAEDDVAHPVLFEVFVSWAVKDNATVMVLRRSWISLISIFMKIYSAALLLKLMLMNADKRRILIVENDPDLLFILDTVFNNAGYVVESCSAGFGIVEFKHRWPDLFILDNDLPTINGLAISKFLRVHSLTQSIPIIMFSKHNIEHKAQLAGVDEFMCKPFELRHLLKTVQKHLNDLHYKEYA